MKRHWVLLIVVLIMLPVECAILLLAFAMAVAALHLGLHFDNAAWWLLFFTTFAALQYLGLYLIRPHELILRLLRRNQDAASTRVGKRRG